MINWALILNVFILGIIWLFLLFWSLKFIVQAGKQKEPKVIEKFFGLELIKKRKKEAEQIPVERLG